MILGQAMFIEMASARQTGDESENAIAEGEALLRVGFFAKSQSLYSCHKGSIFGWLFLRVNLSKNSP